MNYIYISLILIAFLPMYVYASRLYISPQSELLQLGGELVAQIKVDTEGKSINVVDTSIHFPSDMLEVKSISKANSIFTIWAEEPTYSNGNGVIEFVSGSRLGFVGIGTVLTILFTSKKAGTSNVLFGPSRVLLHDGKATESLKSTTKATYVVQELIAPTQPSAPVVIDKEKVELVLPEVTLPLQLFDIDLTIVDRSLSDDEELVLYVNFTSFGTETTLVDLIFTIVDESGKEVHTETDFIFIETEAVMTKKFDTRSLSSGAYRLLVHTVYNTDVEDDFEQHFIVEKKKAPVILVSILFVVVTFFAFLYMFIRRKV